MQKIHNYTSSLFLIGRLLQYLALGFYSSVNVGDVAVFVSVSGIASN